MLTEHSESVLDRIRTRIVRFSSSPLAGVFRNLLKVRLAGAGLAILSIFAIIAVFAPIISPYSPYKQDYKIRMEGPSISHWLGTDHLGRDTLSRLFYGARVSLLVGVVAVSISMAIGVPLGLLSGYLGGWIDEVVMRVLDALYAFPSLILALAIVAILSPGMTNVMIAVGITSVPLFARLARSETLSIREREYVTASEAIGASSFRILRRHVWPNSTYPIIVQGSLGMAHAVLTEAGLSFLGVGVRPPTSTWGLLLREGYPYLAVAPWQSIFPGLCIILLVLSLNFVGDALRDVLDPRLGRALGLR